MPLTKQQLVAALAINAIREIEKNEMEEKKKIKSRKYWVNPFLQKRMKFDIELNLIKDLMWEGGDDFNNFCRLTFDQFESLFSMVETNISKKDTQMRCAIPSKVRLATTLRYIASGDSFRSLEFLTRISRKTISSFVPEVLRAIYNALQPIYLKMPTTEEEWQAIANDFNSIWHFPHVLGCVDGKHVRMKAPAHSGSLFYNYKGFFSIILLAVVDAHGRFTFIDVGANGKSHDSAVFKNSFLYNALKKNELNIPLPQPLPGQLVRTPYFFLGDNAFALENNVMKGFNRKIKLTTTQEILNYRLSRTRMIVEMAFGRLASRFRIFQNQIEVIPDTCDWIIKCACVLHNLLTKNMSTVQDIDMKEFPQVFTNLNSESISQSQTKKPNDTRNAIAVRKNLMSYCVTEGDVPYQWIKINKTNMD